MFVIPYLRIARIFVYRRKRGVNLFAFTVSYEPCNQYATGVCLAAAR